MILSVKDASRYLTDKGIKYSPNTLNKLRCNGGGPIFHKIGNYRVGYLTDELDAFINSLISEGKTHTDL